MKELSNIREYVEKMANIISTVVDMNVLICDTSFRIIGDADHHGIPCEEIEHLSNNSVSYICLTERKPVYYTDAKSENKGCRECKKRDLCDTISIIAIPMLDDNDVIGSIALYASKESTQNEIVNKREYLYNFLEQISELIILKLKDEERDLENRIIRKNMAETLNTIPYPIVNVDKLGNIKECNNHFENFIGYKLEYYMNIYTLLNNMNNNDLTKFLRNTNKRKEGQFSLKHGHKYIDYDISVIPTMIDGSFNGALITFQSAADVYAKANKLFTHITATGFNDIIGISPQIKNVISEAKAFAKSSSTIMINGESGTGKEVLASAIHCESNYGKGPFVAVNCAGIPDNLLESELFGYADGAFTGARKGGKIGKFELADGGTLFLDEIGELPIHLQPKLLRILQEMKLQRIGSNITKAINVRIIVATNRNLEEMIRSNEFREDLFYRLNVIPIFIPPLRERKEDIEPLNNYFLDMYSSMLRKNIDYIDDEAKIILKNYNWPGNVRELQNAIEYAVNKTSNNVIKKIDLPEKILSKGNKESHYTPISLTSLERDAIVKGLVYYGNSKNSKDLVAKDLGISRATLYRRLKELNIDS